MANNLTGRVHHPLNMNLSRAYFSKQENQLILEYLGYIKVKSYCLYPMARQNVLAHIDVVIDPFIFVPDRFLLMNTTLLDNN